MAKKNPRPLLDLSLDALCQPMLREWIKTYHTNPSDYSEHFTNEIIMSIPLAMYDKVFERMVESHVRSIHNRENVISVSALINSIISPKLRRLDLHSLCYIGINEAKFLNNTLINKLPFLVNLVELSLRTSDKGFPLSLCTDATLKEVGSSCSKLSSLDVSYNNTVTDEGLRFLIPSEYHDGCPELIKLLMDDCDVTNEGAVALLEGLPKLKLLGFGETGQSVVMLYHRAWPDKAQPLELTACNNLGTFERCRDELCQLEFNNPFVYIISELCPKLNALKIRVSDVAIKLLHEFPNVTTLDLVYEIHNRGYSPSPGINTVQYLQLFGAQLVSLAFTCNEFSTQYLKVVCDECNNLNQLSIQCNEFNCDKDYTTVDKTKCVLTKLEKFKFGISCITFNLCHVPSNVFTYVLHKSYVLTDISLTMKNTLFSDSYFDQLFSSIKTPKVKSIQIQVPSVQHTVQLPLRLTMVTVNALIGVCPELERLGEMCIWSVSSEEIKELRSQLKVNNSALVIT